MCFLTYKRSHKFGFKRLVLVLAGSIFLLLIPTEGWSLVYTMGAGASGCGKVIENYNSKGKIDYPDLFWVQGYMSAMNEVNDSLKGEDVSPESVYHAVLNYCREDPLKLLKDATFHVYTHELKEP